MYIGGDYVLNQIINNKSINDKKILLVRDSFGCAFASFLLLTCKNLGTIDCSHYKEGAIFDYVEKSKPDIVIILFNLYEIQYVE